MCFILFNNEISDAFLKDKESTCQHLSLVCYVDGLFHVQDFTANLLRLHRRFGL